MNVHSPSRSGGARLSGNAPVSPLVTVVTATYGALEGLKSTVASVREQDFKSVEHVIIDGASSDGTVEYLESLGDAVTLWISEPDTGIADAMNKGLAQARGQYVLVLHAEDTFIDRGALGRAVEHLSNSSEDILSFDVLFIRNGTGRAYRSRAFCWKTYFKTTIPHQGAFCRRDVFDRIGMFDTSFRICMDYEFFLRALRRGVTCRLVPETVSCMPATGTSSRLDWPSLRQRFVEESRVQDQHCPNRLMRAVYAIYWPFYLTYRRARELFYR
jgi:glycosyltransferase involved in cell wall biosynthesis